MLGIIRNYKEKEGKILKKLSFYQLLSTWLLIAVILLMVNGFMLKSSAIHSGILASLGIFLIIYPVYPTYLENRYSEKKCKCIIRIIALAEIIFSFCIRTTF